MKKKIIVLALSIFCVLILQGCFLLDNIILPDEKPTPEVKEKSLSVGDRVDGKTIVWENTGSGNWRFLAMGTPSNVMPWDLDDSKHISQKSLSTNMGRGKANSVFLKNEFSSKMHTPYDCAVLYCISKGGWLPSRDEAEKMGQFTSSNFWTSNCEPSAKAFYYSPIQKSLQSKFRSDKDSIVTIPVYYLDSKGNLVEPYLSF